MSLMPKIVGQVSTISTQFRTVTVAPARTPAVPFTIEQCSPEIRWLKLPAPKGTLTERMQRDEAFARGVEEGMRQHEQGQFSSLEDMKRRLGDVWKGVRRE